MEEFSTLASRIAVSVGEIRGCVILSRDGLVLGSYPPGEDEAVVKPAWLRFAGVGDPERGFVEFGDEVWVYVRRGPYAAFAVSATGARPGLIMDHLEQALLSAEELRSKREALQLPETPPAPSGKPRTSLHREAARPREQAPTRARADGPTVSTQPPPATPAPGPAAGGREAGEPGPPGPPPAAARPPESEPAAVDRPTPSPEPPRSSPGSGTDAEDAEDAEDGGEVDRVLLAQEFSRLLQDDAFGDEE